MWVQDTLGDDMQQTPEAPRAALGLVFRALYDLAQNPVRIMTAPELSPFNRSPSNIPPKTAENQEH